MTTTQESYCPTADLDRFWNDQHDDYIKNQVVERNLIEYKQPVQKSLERKRIQCCFVCFSDVSTRNNESHENNDDNDNNATNKERDNQQKTISTSRISSSDKNQNQTNTKNLVTYSRRPSEEDALKFIKNNNITKEELNIWTVNFEKLISSHKGSQLFRLFCESEFSSENINFYLEVQEFQKLNLTEEESQVRLQKLYDDYISDKSENQVSVLNSCQENYPDPYNSNKTLSCLDQFLYRNDFIFLVSNFVSFRSKMEFHYLALAILGQIVTLSSAFNNKRKNLNLTCCNGRPAMPRFGDLILSKRNRLIWINLHILMCETLYMILFDPGNLSMPYFGVYWQQFYQNAFAGSVLFRIVAIIFYFFFYGPVFVAVANGTIFNLFAISLWIIYFMIITCWDMSNLTPWFGDTDNIAEIIFYIRLPTAVSGIILFFLLGYKLILQVQSVVGSKKEILKNNASFLFKIFEFTNDAEPIQELFSADQNYAEDMKKSGFYQEVDATLNPTRNQAHFTNIYWTTLRKLGYKPKYGYRYPIRVLCGVFCTLTLMFQGIISAALTFVPILRELITATRDNIDQAREYAELFTSLGIATNGSYFSDPERVAEYLYDSARILYGSFITAIILAVLNCLIGVLWHLRSFRFDNRRVRRGFRQDIPTDKVNNFSKISAGMKYGAYICAYPIWGMVLQFFLWFVILFLAIEIVFLPIKIDGVDAWFVQFLKRSWPGWLYTIAIMVTQLILSRFVFSVDRTSVKKAGKYDRADDQGHILITNRLLYDMLSLFFWFNYVFIGFISLLMRVIWTIIMALVFIGRLDQPAVQRNFETRDAGYAVYLGYQGFEEGNTHPILLVSLQYFLAGPAGQRYRNRILGKNDDDSKKVCLMSKSSYRAKWRWQFAYTMVRNQSLVVYRLQTAHKQRIRERKEQEDKLRDSGRDETVEHPYGGPIHAHEVNL